MIKGLGHTKRCLIYKNPYNLNSKFVVCCLDGIDIYRICLLYLAFHNFT